MNLLTTPASAVGQARANQFVQDAPITGVRRLIGFVLGANVNQTNTDIAVPLLLLPGTNFIVERCYFNNASISLTTATVGVFNQTGGSGTAIVSAGQALSSLTSATVNLSATLNAAGATNVVLNAATLATPNTLYLRVGTAQGAAATVDFYIWADVLP